MNKPTLASVEQHLREMLCSTGVPPRVTAAKLSNLSPLLSGHTVAALAREILADETLLKAVAARSYTHSLGFRKVTLFDKGFTLRLHIWDPEAEAQAVPLKESKHEHSFDFISRILYGGMETHCYSMQLLSRGEEALVTRATRRLAKLSSSDAKLAGELLSAMEAEEAIALGSKQSLSPLAATAQEGLMTLLRLTAAQVAQIAKFNTRLQYDPKASVFGGNYILRSIGNTKLISHSVTQLKAGDLYFHGHELAHRLYMPANQPNATLVVTTQVSDDALGSSLQNVLSVQDEKSEFARRMYTAEEMRNVLQALLTRIDTPNAQAQLQAQSPGTAECDSEKLINLADNSRPLRIGLIGPGSVADQWLVPALRKLPNACLWSVLGRDEGKTRNFSLKHQAQASQPHHTQIERFLGDPLLDAVIIASPDKLHLEHALACASAGKHIFLEKPMATSVSDAKRIEAACRKHGVMLMVGYHLRFHQGHRKLAEMLNSGVLGEPLSMRLVWTMQAPANDWRKSSHLGKWWSLGALGTHGIDLAGHLLTPVCGKVKELSAKLAHEETTDGQGGSDKTSVVRLRFQNGTQAEIVSSLAFKAPRTIEIICEKGRIYCLDTLGARGGGTITINDQELSFEKIDPYQAELSHFADRISKPLDFTDLAPACDAASGRENIAYIEKATTRTQS